MSNSWRDRITENAVELFSHAPDPLENTFDYPRDPGLFGPESITWLVMSDVASFIGGIRALVVQAAHPEVAAGVSEVTSTPRYGTHDQTRPPRPRPLPVRTRVLERHVTFFVPRHWPFL